MVYIDNTCYPPQYKLTDHRAKARKPHTKNKFHQYMLKIGLKNFDYEIIKFFPCNNENELRDEMKKEIEKIPHELRLNEI